MFSWQRLLILFAVLSAIALAGPGAALANGPSAGDQQYVDPLGGGNGGSGGSHHSSGGSQSSSSGSSSSSSSGSTSSQPTAVAPATSTTPLTTTTTPSATTSTSTTTTTTDATSATTTPSSSATAADPAGKTLPRTGFDALLGGVLGLGMLGSGLYLRRALRANRAN